MVIAIAFFSSLLKKFLADGTREATLENYVPFELDSDIKFLIYLIWIFWTNLSVSLAGIGTDFLIFSTVTLLVINFKILKEDFVIQINSRNSLKNLVDRHLELFESCDKIQEIFNDMAARGE